jgi:hypothetical protein
MRSEGHLVELPAGYAAILAELKDQIKSARIKAGLAVNRELVLRYWRIDRRILGQQQAGQPGGDPGAQGEAADIRVPCRPREMPFRGRICRLIGFLR